MSQNLPPVHQPIKNLAIGKIIEVDGVRIVAELSPHLTELSRTFGGEVYPIGQFGSIVRMHYGRRLIYAFVSRLRMKADYEIELGGSPSNAADERIIEAHLFGEGEWSVDSNKEGRFKFERGVATYPLPQQTIYLTPKQELRYILEKSADSSIKIGEHAGSGGAACYADFNELFGKHTAILGSTGSGKSCAVASIIHSIIDRNKDESVEHWNPEIIILDPHNEYGSSFPNGTRLSTDDGSLKLPYWLLDLEETIALLIGRTEFAATSQANIVKNALYSARLQAAKQLGLEVDKINVDSPVPYSLGDPTGLDEFGNLNNELYNHGLVGAINEQRPAGKNKSQHSHFNKILAKLASLLRDERLAFMMDEWDGAGSDPMPDILANLVDTDSPVTVIDLSGVPNEVAGTASAVIARTLFYIKVWQQQEEREATPVVLVCEEAHRYVPNSGEAQYGAAQSSIRRIAKEGRKYGLGLLLVSQRPSEVETTVLSQCNSWIVLRITNETDRTHVNGVLPDSMTGLTKMLSGLRRREAIFVGEASTIPSRILLRELSEDKIPRSSDIDFDKGWQSGPTASHWEAVSRRWRYQEKA